jgi:hypothetical protein
VDFEVVVFALDAAVDVEVHGSKHAVGFALMAGFDAGGVMGVIEKSDLLADETDGSFKETALQSHGAVFGHPAAGLLAEVILKILGRSAHALAVAGIAGQRSLAGASMLAVVVELAQPAIESQVKIVESFSV